MADRQTIAPGTDGGHRVTDLLAAWSRGVEGAEDELARIVYHELHRLASNHLRRERRGHTLQPTALVHDAFLRLVERPADRWRDRRQFFAIASRVMRQVLVDHARRRGAARRGGDAVRLAFDEGLFPVPGPAPDLLALDEALGELAALDPVGCRVIELRFFTGLGHREIAALEGVSLSTVERRWRVARAWLYRRLGGDLGDSHG